MRETVLFQATGRSSRRSAGWCGVGAETNTHPFHTVRRRCLTEHIIVIKYSGIRRIGKLRVVRCRAKVEFTLRLREGVQLLAGARTDYGECSSELDQREERNEG